MKILWQAYDRKNYTAGPIINAIRILPELKRIGFDVHAIIGNDGSGHPNADILSENGISVFNYVKPRYSEAHVLLFLNHVSKVKPDIFVSNISVQAGLAGRWIRHWGIPVIHTIRSEDSINIGMSKFFFGNKSEWNLDALVSVNIFLLEKIRQDSEVDFKYAVIPSGVIIDKIQKINTNSIKKLKIIYTGRLVQKQKSIFDLLDSFVEAAKLNPYYHFTFMGSGGKVVKERLYKVIGDNDLNDRFQLLDPKFGSKYKEELSKHHVILLMSDYEGIPGSLMDGMSCGLIPICTNIHGIDELIENCENGFIIKNGNEDFYHKLDMIFKDGKLRNKLSLKAIDTIKNKFSLHHSATCWDALFKKLYKPNSIKKIKLPKKITLPPVNHLLVEHIMSPDKSRYWKAKNWLNKKIKDISY